MVAAAAAAGAAAAGSSGGIVATIMAQARPLLQGLKDVKSGFNDLKEQGGQVTEFLSKQATKVKLGFLGVAAAAIAIGAKMLYSSALMKMYLAEVSAWFEAMGDSLAVVLMPALDAIILALWKLYDGWMSLDEDTRKFLVTAVALVVVFGLLAGGMLATFVVMVLIGAFIIPLTALFIVASLVILAMTAELLGLVAVGWAVYEALNQAGVGVSGFTALLNILKAVTSFAIGIMVGLVVGLKDTWLEFFQIIDTEVLTPLDELFQSVFGVSIKEVIGDVISVISNAVTAMATFENGVKLGSTIIKIALLPIKAVVLGIATAFHAVVTVIQTIVDTIEYLVSGDAWKDFTGLFEGLNIGKFFENVKFGIPSFQIGGTVTNDGLASLHKGDVVQGPGTSGAGGFGGDITVIIQNPSISSDWDLDVLAEKVGKKLYDKLRTGTGGIWS